MTMKLTSDAFFHNRQIPSLYTCDGLDISPPLEWSGLPPDTKSMTLIIYDPDAPNPAAPRMIWTHWILYNLPANCSGLEQGICNSELPPGTREGLNSWSNTNYGGPALPLAATVIFSNSQPLKQFCRTWSILTKRSWKNTCGDMSLRKQS